MSGSAPGPLEGSFPPSPDTVALEEWLKEVSGSWAQPGHTPRAPAYPEPPLASREGSHVQGFLSLTRKTHLTPSSLLLLYVVYITKDSSRSVVLNRGWLHPVGDTGQCPDTCWYHSCGAVIGTSGYRSGMLLRVLQRPVLPTQRFFRPQVGPGPWWRWFQVGGQSGGQVIPVSGSPSSETRSSREAGWGCGAGLGGYGRSCMCHLQARTLRAPVGLLGAPLSRNRAEDS